MTIRKIYDMKSLVGIETRDKLLYGKSMGSKTYEERCILEGKLVIDGSIYYKPCVDLIFRDNVKLHRNFDTYQEALDFESVSMVWIKKPLLFEEEEGR